jgi:Spy/CpxP family protein refolding chaperone
MTKQSEPEHVLLIRRSSMTRRTLVGTGALALLMAAGTVMAQGARCGGPGVAHGKGMGIMRALHRVSDLSEQQEEQIDKIVLALRKDMRAARTEKAEDRGELRELIKAGASDREIAAKVEERSKEHAVAAKTRALAMRDIVKILTPEQREELFAAPDDRPGRGGPRGMRRGHGRW